ncbi:MAG: cadherin-like domain-containing protein, partial [Rhodobacteraceae bacterium]|nr:cadherin-like domain-containing protein [Paracoccaceae bacterium]
RDDNFSLNAGSIAIDSGDGYDGTFTDFLGNQRSDDPDTPDTGAGFELFVETQEASSLFAPVGTPQDWGSNNQSIELDLPFGFEFYGEIYDSVWVATEGFLQFGSRPNVTGNNSVDELIANIRIAPMWDDLTYPFFTASDDIYVDDTVANQITIRWRAKLAADSSQQVDFSVTLFSDGIFRFDYGEGNQQLSPTIGISAGNGATFVISSLNGQSDLGNANSVSWAPTPGLTFFDIGAIEFQGSSNDTTPPQVVSVSNIPANGGETALAFTSLAVEFSESLDQISANSVANYQLIEAGADGLFDTVDDVKIAVSPLYAFPETDLTLIFDDGALPEGDYRLTLSGTLALLDTSGLALDGDENGTLGGDYIRLFTVDRATNAVPVPNPQALNVAEDGSIIITLTATDGDGDDLTYSIATQPDHGTLTEFDPVARTVRYTPDADFFGADSFDFRVEDDKLGIATATISLTVDPVNDLPTAADQTVDAFVGEPRLIIPVISDVETAIDDLTIVIDQQPTLGTVQVTSNGLLYTPTTLGADSFTYIVQDDNNPVGESPPATVSITVDRRDTAPEADISIAANAVEGTTLTLTIDNYVDAEGDLPTAIEINWGDGSQIQRIEAPNIAVPIEVQHLFADGNATPFVRV